jgi:glutaredoxin
MINKFKLELYFFPECPYCQLVTNTIDSLGIGPQIEFRNIRTNSNFQQKLFADTGRRTVPCLYVNDKPMHESKDIVLWLKSNVKLITKD